MSCARSRNSRRSPSPRRKNKCTHHSSSPRGRNRWRSKSPPENCWIHIFSEAQAARALLLAPSASAVTNTASRTAMPLLSGTAHALPSANALGEDYKHATPTIPYASTGNDPKGARPSPVVGVPACYAVHFLSKTVNTYLHELCLFLLITI